MLLGGGLIFKNRLIFHPSDDLIDSPLFYSLQVEELWLELDDGTKLRAWLAPAPLNQASQAAPDEAVTIETSPLVRDKIALVLQGNSGNVSMMSSRLAVLNSLGLAALTVDYPGYGPNQGHPSEAKVYQSAEAAWQWATRQGYRPEDILIFGYSLGGGVASHLAEQHPPAALVLDSTFTRLRDVPAWQFPWLSPYFYLILRDAFDTRARLERIQCPLLILHSPGDEVVPFALGLGLYQTYQNNYKDMAEGHGGHTDFFLNQPLYQARIAALLVVAWPDETPPENDALK